MARSGGHRVVDIFICGRLLSLHSFLVPYDDNNQPDLATSYLQPGQIVILPFIAGLQTSKTHQGG
jgi:hypothetical protein